MGYLAFSDCKNTLQEWNKLAFFPWLSGTFSQHALCCHSSTQMVRLKVTVAHVFTCCNRTCVIHPLLPLPLRLFICFSNGHSEKIYKTTTIFQLFVETCPAQNTYVDILHVLNCKCCNRLILLIGLIGGLCGLGSQQL